MVEEDASDGEWRAFCTREKKRRAEKDRKWLAWIDEESSDSPARVLQPESPDNIEIWNNPATLELEHITPPREPSATLETPPENSPEEVREEETRDTRTKGTESVVRRSRRSRRKTEKALYGEQVRKQGQTYKKHETASRTTTRQTQPQRGREKSRISCGGTPVVSLCLQVDPVALKAAKSRVGPDGNRKSLIEEIWERQNGIFVSHGLQDRIKDPHPSQPALQTQSSEVGSSLESERDVRETRLEPAGPAERSYSGSVNEGKAKNVSPSNESVGLAVGEINEELGAPGSGTKYPSFVPPGSSRIHPPNDDTVNSSAPLVRNSAPPARCLNKFEDERDDPGHIHDRNSEARELEGWGFLPDPSKRRHSDGDQSPARKSRDPLQTANQFCYGSGNENHSPARPVLEPTHDEEVTPFDSESSGDDILRKNSCDEWEPRRVCECPERAPYILARSETDDSVNTNGGGLRGCSTKPARSPER